MDDQTDNTFDPTDQPAGPESSKHDSKNAAEGGDFNEVSQDDIDALLKDSSPSDGDSGRSESIADDLAGAVSQDDIDALLNSNSDHEAASASTEHGVEGESPNAHAPAEAGGPVGAQGDDGANSVGRPFDEVASAMQNAIDAERAEADAAPFEPAELDLSEPEGVDPKRVTMLSDVKLRLKVLLGRTRMLVEDVLKLDEGSVVELDKLAGDPVDILVNDRLIARGEVLVLNENFCVRISEVMSHDPHRITT